MSILEVPDNATIISSHTVYRIKVEGDDAHSLKARIAPHGNENALNFELKSDCDMGSSLGFWIVLTKSAINSWIIVRANDEVAFLKTGEASRDLYIPPPRESEDSPHYWPLLAAVYGLANSNATFQTQTDCLLLAFGPSSVTVVTQLLNITSNSKFDLLVAKVADNLLITGVMSHVDDFLVKFGKIFQIGRVPL